MLNPVYKKRIFLWCSPALLLFLLFSFAGHAQSPFRQFTTEHGLPSSETYDVLEDRDGYIWIATDNGVSRYDGYRFENFGPEEGLNSPVVLKLYEDYRGRIWFCTLDSRLFYYQHGRIIPYPFNPIIEKQYGRYVKHIHLSREDVLTVALPAIGYLVIDPDGAYELSLLPCARVLMKLDSSGYLPGSGSCFSQLLESSRTVKIMADGRGLDSVEVEPIRKQYLVFMVSTNRKDIQLYSYSGHLFEVSKEKLSVKKSFNETIIYLDCDSDGHIYLQVPTERGVRKYNSYDDLVNDRYEPILEGYKPTGLQQDPSGGLWFSTLKNGVLYFPAQEPKSHPGLAGRAVTALSVKSRTELYVGQQNGDVLLVDGTSIQRLPPSPGDISPVFDLCYDPVSKTLWKGSFALHEWTGSRWQVFTGSSFGKEHQAWTTGRLGSKRIFIAPSGRLWGVNYANWGFCKLAIPTRSFLFSSTIEPQTPHSESSSAKRTQVVFEDRAGRVWVGNVEGLFRFTPEEVLVRPPVDHPAFRLRVEDIHEMADSTLVIGTKGGGLLLWKGEKVRSITTRDGLTSDMIERVHVDSAQHIWAGTLNGLNLIRLNGPDSVRVYTYTLADGMPSDEITDIDSYGDQVWVGTTRGLVKMPTRFTRNPFSPAPLLRGMEVNGTFVHRDSLRDLAYNQNNLQVDLLAVNPKMNGRIRYRYRLHAGEDWTYTTDRYLNFPRLRPDAYRLEAQAENEDGVWSASAVLPFTIRPAFWATWWFRGLILLALGASVVLGVRTRIRRLREEAGRRQERAELQRELSELERAALRAQMNPHFLSNCLNSIQGLIVRGEKAEAMRYLAVFHQLLRQTLNLSRKRSVPLEEDVALLRTYLELEQMRSGIPFRYRIEIDPALDTFELEVPPLLVQPYVENAILHAFPPTVSDPLIEITYRAQPGGLEIAVTDNGIGMEKSRPQRSGPFTKERSYGMDIPRRRLEILTGAAHQVQIEQRKGEGGKIIGTRVRLRIPTTDPDRQTDTAKTGINGPDPEPS